MYGNGTVIRTVMFQRPVQTVAVDQHDSTWYVATAENLYESQQSHSHVARGAHISYCRFESNFHTLLISLSDLPQEIKVVDGYVFWSSWSPSKNTWSIFSCEKGSGNRLEQHVSTKVDPRGPTVTFDVLFQNPEHSNICSGGLCSHICIPSIAGYIQCACPVGFRLRSDGWTCGIYLFIRITFLICAAGPFIILIIVLAACIDADHCDSAYQHQPQNKINQFSSKSVMSLSGNCGRDQFQCLSSQECIQMNQACDGHRDCKDSSDEDPRK